MPKFAKMKIKFDAIVLLKAIRTSIHKFKSTRYKYASLQRAYKKYFSFKQMKLSNSDYLEGSIDRYQLIADHGGTIGPVDDKTLITEELRSIPPIDSSLTDATDI